MLGRTGFAPVTLCVTVALTLCARPVRANTVVLTTSGCSAGCTTSPFGMITLTQDVDGVSVDIQVTLDSDANGAYHFHKASDPNHFAFAFDIVGNPTVTFTNLTTGFTAAGTLPGSYNASPFGSFDYALRCSGCGSGYGGGLTGPLQLTVTPSIGALTPVSFTPAGAAHFFTVDIVDFLGNSGNVADPGDPGSPEPSTSILLGSALVALGILARRHRSP